jgi:enoyl-CoA hydratase/carnithine racemase/3-hydroxyacyl-CoA dehydrogenase
MVKALRSSTLHTMGLGSLLPIFQRGSLPVTASDAVERVFGPPAERGSLVISGANGIVGAGKAMQLGARLEPFGVPVVALDFPAAPDGLGRQYAGLVRAFGKDTAARIRSNVTVLAYDGVRLPAQLALFRPRVLLEAVPEVLAIKKAHYEVFRAAYPGIEIRSVTSGFPRSELGVGITHPAFPHEINKVFEVVEPVPSPFTQLLWALGLTPMPVSDHWSFVLDVLFCGLTLAALRYHQASNMPFWKIDKLVRRLLGPNPLRAHDAIGARGANFLTWSCLHHLAQHYGELFTPTPALAEHRESGQDWYPPNHFRPIVDWPRETVDGAAFEAWILGPLFQMTSLMLYEERSHLAQMNAIGELCAQFSRGVLAVIRSRGADAAATTVEAYHRLHPAAAASAWHPETLARIDSPEWQQLYVNAEHDGRVGVIGIGRESYNWDVDAELNRAIDWLQAESIERVIVTGDFHLAGQMVGADTAEFFPALADAEEGVRIAEAWSRTARRLHDEFAVSVGFVNGKRCLGGFLELLLHCHYLIAVDGASLGMPEVTLPVVPGMEGCHWPFRKTAAEHWPRLLALLLEGRPVQARDAQGWLVDRAAPLDDALALVWRLASGAGGEVPRRAVAEGVLADVAASLPSLRDVDAGGEAARKAILASVQGSCGVPLSEALAVQARHSGAFMASPECLAGAIGSAYKRTTAV